MMGIMPCERCPNILCDRWCERYGYLCDECFEELVEMAQIGPVDLDAFMVCETASFDAREYYGNIFRR
jgi:hypothetical protein